MSKLGEVAKKIVGLNSAAVAMAKVPLVRGAIAHQMEQERLLYSLQALTGKPIEEIKTYLKESSYSLQYAYDYYRQFSELPKRPTDD